MRYLALIYSDEKMAEQATPEQQEEVMGAYMAFTEMVIQKGVHLGGEALLPTSSATTVRVRDGKTVTTDGPFAETKEQLGGYYLFQAKDLDEAIEYAAKIPGASLGTVELRPVWEFEAH